MLKYKFLETNRPRRYSICSLPSITTSTADSGCSNSEPQNLLKTALISSYQVNSLSFSLSRNSVKSATYESF